jgi:hypothetical protein
MQISIVCGAITPVVFSLDLPAGSTLSEARQQILARQPTWADYEIGVFGKVRPLETVLQAQDRVEFYLPLACDPKAVRRARAKGTRV